MSVLDRFYDYNPIGVIDQNQWTDRDPEINLAFRRSALYTPLIQWSPLSTVGGASSTIEFEMIEGDVNHNEIPLTANYTDSFGVDSRYRQFAASRYAGKVQMHKSSNIFQMWKISGGRDWRPLLQGMLGDHMVRLNEQLARRVWFQGPKKFWTYSNLSGGGAPTNWATLTSSDKFDISIANQWKLRLGNTGAPILPDSAGAQLAIVPPGVVYDVLTQLPSASGNETALWRDAHLYAGGAALLNYEVGTLKGIRLQEAPSDRFGINPNVLYNAGTITKQYGVTAPIRMGDGAPNPDTTAVDGVWHVGQKNTTHFVQLESAAAAGDFAEDDWVTIHVKTTPAYGVTNGVDPFDGMTIVRRVVAYDDVSNTIAFDRPILMDYTAGFTGQSVTGATPGTFFAYVTKGMHIGYSLVLGSRGGVAGKVVQSPTFYEPKPVDDFDSVWRFSYDQVVGYNIAEPHAFELYFFAVSLPKPGGVA